MAHTKLLLLVVLVSGRVQAACDYGLSQGSGKLLKLPSNFMFGEGTSAGQTEGAWDADGKKGFTPILNFKRSILKFTLSSPSLRTLTPR